MSILSVSLFVRIWSVFGLRFTAVMAQNNPSLAPFHSWGRPVVFCRLRRNFSVWRMEPGTGAAARILFPGDRFGRPCICMGNSSSFAEAGAILKENPGQSTKRL